MKKSVLKKTRAQNVRDAKGEVGATEKIKKQAAEYLAGWQRARADYKNLVARFEKQKDELTKTASKDLIMDLLPVIDNLERALRADARSHPKEPGAHGRDPGTMSDAKQSRTQTDSAKTDFREGIELILKQLYSLLASRGVEKIKCVGKTFDPALHEAVGRVEGPANKCVNEHTTGYKMGDLVLRPSRVDVGSQKNN